MIPWIKNVYWFPTYSVIACQFLNRLIILRPFSLWPNPVLPARLVISLFPNNTFLFYSFMPLFSYFLLPWTHGGKLLQSCPTLCHPVACSLPDWSVHGILQERILEWVAIPFSRGSSRPRDACPALQADSLPSEPLAYISLILEILPFIQGLFKKSLPLHSHWSSLFKGKAPCLPILSLPFRFHEGRQCVLSILCHWKLLGNAWVLKYLFSWVSFILIISLKRKNNIFHQLLFLFFFLFFYEEKHLW